jgi:DNA-binding CsgD family transcriptional regulator
MLFNKKQNELIIKTRNKELTTNALQFIEKERTVNDLLKIIKDQLPDKYSAISKTYKQSNEKVWEDFHLRFTQTNNEFYKRLLELHPSLTPKDLKHCALIKLKFDSKEMSHMLGISLHSVHMARSRVRKKLNLKREESLSNYIALI